MVQLIKKQPVTVRIDNVDYEYVKPYFLMKKDSLILKKATVVGSQMGWNFLQGRISFNQIRKLIK